MKDKKPQIRERVLENGMSFPTDEELIMLILGHGTQQMPIEKLAHKVISTIDDSNDDDRMQKLLSIEGIGKSKALIVSAAIELGRRKYSHLKSVIKVPSDIVPYVQHYAMEQKEHFICATINGAHELIATRVISIGTVNKTLIHPREIFAEAVAERASGIICCHNHPYGSCIPSEADCESTKVLQKAADILGIAFLDHIIITRDGYYSFLEHDLLDSISK